jgi:hypothetical protein
VAKKLVLVAHQIQIAASGKARATELSTGQVSFLTHISQEFNVGPTQQRILNFFLSKGTINFTLVVLFSKSTFVYSLWAERV